MSLQTLSDKFNTILTQYQETYQNYLNALNSSDKSFTIAPRTQFTSDSIISTNQGSNVASCHEACISKKSCSGATFNKTNNTCTLNRGTGNLVKSLESISIVQQGVFYSYQLQQLNAELTAINKEMMNMATQSVSQFQQSSANNQEQESILQQNYQVLTNERLHIDRMVREFETLNEAENNGQVNVTSNYYRYIILLIVSILLIFLLIKFSITGEQRGGGSNFKKEAIFLFGIMVIFLGLSKFFNEINSYILVSVILIAYLITKIKVNQSI
jgi:hypothetical protein